MTEYKICTRCNKQYHSDEDFGTNRLGQHRKICIGCQEYAKKYKEDNKDKIKEYGKKNRDKRKEYKEQNKDRLSSNQKEWEKINRAGVEIECPNCKCEIGIKGIVRHQRTSKCIDNAKTILDA